MKKKIMPIIILALLFCLLLGCTGNLSNEFHSSFKQFKESHLNSKGLKTDFLSASKSMEIETVETWFLNLKKSEESAKFELSKGIYNSLKYAQESKASELPESMSNNSEDSKSSNDAKLYYVVMTQQALAEEAIF